MRLPAGLRLLHRRARMSAKAGAEPVEVLVVGGGQAGLAVGQQLAARSVPFLIVDGGDGPGSSWRNRWDSLRLFTPAAYSSLPGMAFPGPPDALPGKDAAADYLAAYATRFTLPVRWQTRVTRLGRGDAGFDVRTADGAGLVARHVVLATGAHQRPWRPALADRLDQRVLQVHSAHYRNPAQLPDGPVLVVGAGNSGVQIAQELAATRPVTLSVGTRPPVIPARIAGRSVFFWLDTLRLLRIPADSRLGRRASVRPDPLIGASPEDLRRRHDVTLTGRIVTVDGEVVTDEHGTAHRPASVVWATGFRPDFSWLDLAAVVDEHGGIRQRQGRTQLPGLYTVGQRWQCTGGSAFLGGVGPDAAAIADAIRAGR